MTGRTGFRLLWAGQSVSLFGTAVSALAIPTVAIIALHATALQVGALEAVFFTAEPLLAIPAGVWIDRSSRRLTMLVADVVRALAVMSIPVAAQLHALTFAQLVAVAAVTGAASAFFGIAYQSYVPALVEPATLEGANARLELSSSAAQVAGNGLAGALIAAVGATLAVVVDAASYAVSALTLVAIRVREPHVGVARERTSFGASAREGVAIVLRSPLLVRIALAVAAWNAGTAIMTSVFLLFAYRVLHLSPATVGFVLAAGNLGFAAALLAPQLARRFGTGRTLLASLTASACAPFAVPLALVLSPVAVLIAVELVTAMAIPIFNITQLSLRQRLVRPEQLGRMNAVMKTIGRVTLPLGALAGGALAQAVGIVPTVIAGAVVGALAIPCLLGVNLDAPASAPAAASAS